jgi:curved DNA-binding protein CbpA
MTSPNKLEIRGNLAEHPLAELLVEAIEARLSGSFRLASDARKAMIYLRDGAVVFAASNARRHRLFEMLLESGRATREQIIAINDFANDQTLGAALVADGALTASELDEIIVRQIEEVVKSSIQWTEGEWIFSPLVRIKDSIAYRIETTKILWEYGRSLSSEKIVRRFRSFQESFGVKPGFESPHALLPEEAFLLSRFENSFLKVKDLFALGTLSEAATIRTLYVLWLGGFLYRQHWNAAFPEWKIAAIHAAKLSVKRDEAETAAATAAAEETEKVSDDSPPTATAAAASENNSDANADGDGKKASAFQGIKEEIFRPAGADSARREVHLPSAAPKNEAPPKNVASSSTGASDERRRLEEYLKRVEEAVTLYEVLGVTPKTDVKEIKTAYFTLAKRFHPDLFHKESGTETHKRIQSAFTEIAHAYETLKDQSSRELYDYKNREKLADPAAAKKSKAAAASAPVNTPEGQAALAKESFEQGYSRMMEEEYAEALPLLARAVHLAPDNARYRAFYGKLLSADEKSTHKAESEMQLAIKLDPNNSMFRLMLAEFYADLKLYRRAEGELQRLLAIFPNNPEARQLLDSLPKK